MKILKINRISCLFFLGTFLLSCFSCFANETKVLPKQLYEMPFKPLQMFEGEFVEGKRHYSGFFIIKNINKNRIEASYVVYHSNHNNMGRPLIIMVNLDGEFNPSNNIVKFHSKNMFMTTEGWSLNKIFIGKFDKNTGIFSGDIDVKGEASKKDYFNYKKAGLLTDNVYQQKLFSFYYGKYLVRNFVKKHPEYSQENIKLFSDKINNLSLLTQKQKKDMVQCLQNVTGGKNFDMVDGYITCSSAHLLPYFLPSYDGDPQHKTEGKGKRIAEGQIWVGGSDLGEFSRVRYYPTMLIVRKIEGSNIEAFVIMNRNGIRQENDKLVFVSQRGEINTEEGTFALAGDAVINDTSWSIDNFTTGTYDKKTGLIKGFIDGKKNKTFSLRYYKELVDEPKLKKDIEYKEKFYQFFKNKEGSGVDVARRYQSYHEALEAIPEGLIKWKNRFKGEGAIDFLNKYPFDETYQQCIDKAKAKLSFYFSTESIYDCQQNLDQLKRRADKEEFRIKIRQIQEKHISQSLEFMGIKLAKKNSKKHVRKMLKKHNARLIIKGDKQDVYDLSSVNEIFKESRVYTTFVDGNLSRIRIVFDIMEGTVESLPNAMHIISNISEKYGEHPDNETSAFKAIVDYLKYRMYYEKKGSTKYNKYFDRIGAFLGPNDVNGALLLTTYFKYFFDDKDSFIKVTKILPTDLNLIRAHSRWLVGDDEKSRGDYLYIIDYTNSKRFAEESEQINKYYADAVKAKEERQKKKLEKQKSLF